MTFGASILRRGVEMVDVTLSNPPKDGGVPQLPKLPVWAYVLFLFTFVVFSLLMFTFQYVVHGVVATLTMIESSDCDVHVAVDTLRSIDDESNDDVAKPLSDPLLEPEALLRRNKPVTTSIRRTIRHLRTHYGSLAPFRGLSLFICLHIARMFITQFFSIVPFMNTWLGFVIASILADITLARWQMTWIQIIISEPTPGKKWWRRALPLSSWSKIAPSVALASLASQVTTVLPIVILMSFGTFKRLRDPEYQPAHSDLNAAGVQLLLVGIFAIVLAILIALPATVILVRVAASMLPEENETVVPFDRAFGGKVTPAIIGGQGKIGMVEAWQSYDWSSRLRLLKLMAKLVGIMVALYLLVFGVSYGEAKLIIAPKYKEMVVGAFAEKLGGGH